MILAVLAACSDPAQGTFVGNPSLQARYVDSVDQVGLGGRLATNGTALEPCSAPTIGLGPQVFTFDGTVASVSIDLPEEELCGIRLVVTELAVQVDDAGVDKTVVGQDFDLWVPSDAIPAGAPRLELRLGDEGWLPGFLALAGPGETLLNTEADPALVAAFFEGLDEGSAFVELP
ncbi:MAG: hypothetical protein H6736_09325 [Alphaproteobacteria bacterium]|nr:hypothetical protein [Alphaproteobacteria bacterium]